VILEQVRDVLRAIHIPEGLLAEMMDYLRQSHEAEKDFHHDRIRGLQKEGEELTQRLDRLTDLLLDRSITRDIYDRKHQQIAERQQEINRLLQDSHEADSQFKIALSGLISLASKAPDLFELSNNAEKRLLIGRLFEPDFGRANPRIFLEKAIRPIGRSGQVSRMASHTGGTSNHPQG
jgi:hypothetical protein